MIGRIEFESKKFKPVSPYKKGVYIKPSFNEHYRWLSKRLDTAGIKHKVIDLDRKQTKSKKRERLGSTLLVEYVGFRYQMIWVWIPKQGIQSGRVGKWGLEVFKKRTGFQKLFKIKRLNERDPLIRTLLGFLQDDLFVNVRYVPESEFNRHP